MRSVITALLLVLPVLVQAQDGWKTLGRTNYNITGDSVTYASAVSNHIGPPSAELTSEEMVTNTWETAVDYGRRGVVPVNEHGRHQYLISALDYGSNLLVMTNAVYSHGAIHFEDGYILGKCDKSHVSDWPKTSRKTYGVQWLRKYEQAVMISETVVTNRWQLHSPPHKKITITTVKRMVESTAVTTNTVAVRGTP